MRNLIADLGRFREGWDLAAQSDRASLRCRLWLLTMIPDPSWTSWMRLPREDPGSCICLYLLGPKLGVRVERFLKLWKAWFVGVTWGLA